ncbi:hypothetical protein SNEBB_005941 [Seison nebaliae]|nr:hypothetical protein SNEBB_005941 [Seison nebaliae]
MTKIAIEVNRSHINQINRQGTDNSFLPQHISVDNYESQDHLIKELCKIWNLQYSKKYSLLFDSNNSVIFSTGNLNQFTVNGEVLIFDFGIIQQMTKISMEFDHYLDLANEEKPNENDISTKQIISTFAQISFISQDKNFSDKFYNHQFIFDLEKFFINIISKKENNSFQKIFPIDLIGDQLKPEDEYTSQTINKLIDMDDLFCHIFLILLHNPSIHKNHPVSFLQIVVDLLTTYNHNISPWTQLIILRFCLSEEKCLENLKKKCTTLSRNILSYLKHFVTNEFQNENFLSFLLLEQQKFISSGRPSHSSLHLTTFKLTNIFTRIKRIFQSTTKSLIEEERDNELIEFVKELESCRMNCKKFIYQPNHLCSECRNECWQLQLMIHLHLIEITGCPIPITVDNENIIYKIFNRLTSSKRSEIIKQKIFRRYQIENNSLLESMETIIDVKNLHSSLTSIVNETIELYDDYSLPETNGIPLIEKYRFRTEIERKRLLSEILPSIGEFDELIDEEMKKVFLDITKNFKEEFLSLMLNFLAVSNIQPIVSKESVENEKFFGINLVYVSVWIVHEIFRILNLRKEFFNSKTILLLFDNEKAITILFIVLMNRFIRLWKEMEADIGEEDKVINFLQYIIETSINKTKIFKTNREFSQEIFRNSYEDLLDSYSIPFMSTSNINNRLKVLSSKSQELERRVLESIRRERINSMKQGAMFYTFKTAIETKVSPNSETLGRTTNISQLWILNPTETAFFISEGVNCQLKSISKNQLTTKIKIADIASITEVKRLSNNELEQFDIQLKPESISAQDLEKQNFSSNISLLTNNNYQYNVWIDGLSILCDMQMQSKLMQTDMDIQMKFLGHFTCMECEKGMEEKKEFITPSITSLLDDSN